MSFQNFYKFTVFKFLSISLSLQSASDFEKENFSLFFESPLQSIRTLELTYLFMERPSLPELKDFTGEGHATGISLTFFDENELVEFLAQTDIEYFIKESVFIPGTRRFLHLEVIESPRPIRLFIEYQPTAAMVSDEIFFNILTYQGDTLRDSLQYISNLTDLSYSIVPIKDGSFEILFLSEVPVVLFEIFLSSGIPVDFGNSFPEMYSGKFSISVRPETLIDDLISIENNFGIPVFMDPEILSRRVDGRGFSANTRRNIFSILPIFNTVGIEALATSSGLFFFRPHPVLRFISLIDSKDPCDNDKYGDHNALLFQAFSHFFYLLKEINFDSSPSSHKRPSDLNRSDGKGREKGSATVIESSLKESNF